MRLHISLGVVLAALATSTWAQSSSSLEAIATLPSCALQCLQGAILNSPCSATNTTCVCADDVLQAQVTSCVNANCTVKQGLFTKNTTETLCGRPVRDQSSLSNHIVVSFGVLSCIAVALRLGFKVASKIELGLDDWTILIALLAGLPSTVFLVVGVGFHGLGRDIWTVPFDDITTFGYWLYVCVVMYYGHMTLLKTAMLLFFLRIFPTVGVRRLIFGTLAFNAVIGVTFVMLGTFSCHPISYFWTKWDGEHSGTCLEINTITWVHAAISIALDIWMLVIPLSQLKTLNLHWKKKIGVGLMFGVGTFVTVVSILRLQALFTFAASQNPTWDDFGTTIWSTIEVNVGIICICMPTIRLILVRIFPFIGSRGSKARGYGYGYGGSSAVKQPQGRGGAGGGSGSRALGSRSHGTITGGPSPAQGVPNKGIHFQTAYSVHYGDSDEASLVQMRNLDFKPHDVQSKGGSEVSLSSH